MYIIIYRLTDSGGGAVIESTEYHELENLTFAPEADITGNSMPVNELTLDIITTDEVTDAQYCELYDDRDNLWAGGFPVITAVRISADVVRVQARSELYRLEYNTLAETVYAEEPIANVLATIFATATGNYSLDSSLSGATISGYCPEQTARERLTWVLLAIGAYVQDVFTGSILIKPVDDTQTLIPAGMTFLRPAESCGDYVTAVKATAYTFSQASSQAEWESDSSSYKFPLPWKAVEQSFTLTNNNVPSWAPENVVEIDELYLINTDNVSDILSRLALYYFQRREAEVSVINNGDYLPGDRIIASLDADRLITGYIRSAAFSFGMQARSTLKLIGVDDCEGAKLTILCKYNNIQIGKYVYTFPVSYGYSIQMPYIDMVLNKHRYVFRPTTETVSGTMTSSGATVTVNYAVALDLYKKVLHVVSVDELTEETDQSTGEVTVVIS